MATSQISMYRLFQAVSKALQQNQSQLNQVDTYNHNHGDNMVEIFNTIASAINENKTATPSGQLSAAASRLRTIPSGSAQYYSKSLNQAATELKREKSLTADNASILLQTLLSGGQPSKKTNSTVTDLLGSLLTNLTGTGSSSSTGPSDQSKIDWATLAAAGMEYMKSKQQGQDTLTSLVDALMVEPTLNAPYRKESGTIVAETLMKVLGSMLTRKS